MENKSLVVANWKATKTIKETITWVKTAKEALEKAKGVDVIVCAPYTSLPPLKSLLMNSNIKVGAQDVSKFNKGAYTGEVTVEMLDGLVDYCIVGHSERRKYFGETDDHVIEKVRFLIEFGITPILCVSDSNQLESYLREGKVIIENTEKIIFVDEPPNAISGGGDYRPDDPINANESAGKIGEKFGKKITTIYGGSLNPDNVKNFFSQDNIQGGLVGQASIDPRVFTDLISKII